MVRGSPITLAEESVDDLLSRQEVTDALAAGIHSGDVVAVRGLIDKRGPYSYWLFQVGGDALVAADAFEDDRGRRAPDIPRWLDVLRGQLAGAHVLEGKKARAETDSFVYKQENGAHLLSHLIVCKVNLSQRTTRTGRKATSNHTFAVSTAGNRRIIKLMAHYMHALVGVEEDSEVAEEEECGEAELDD